MKNEKTHHTNTDHTAIAGEATTELRDLEKRLPMQPPLTAQDKQRALPLLRIGPAAMSIATDLARRHPDRFCDFDVAMVEGAASYETAMAPVAQKCRDLAARIEDSIIAAKVPAVEQTLALYGAAKSLVRFKKGESMLPQVRELKLLVRTQVKHRKPAAGKAKADGASPPAEPPAPKAETPEAPVAKP